MKKPLLSFWQIWNLSFGFFGIQIGFALQNANVSRIFQSLGASIDELPILWIAAPVSGLLVQPLIGHFSDRTWGPFGRRRPYFLAGAVFATLALFVMPHSPYLWVAAGALWILDASINVSMEPFRAFVGDMLPSEQRTKGYAMQTVFIGAGALAASAAPYVLTNYFGVSNEAAEGGVPDSVRLAFYIGGAAFFLAVLWTVLTTKEYAPAELARFSESADLSQRGELSRTGASPAFFFRWGAMLLVLGAAISALVYAYKADQQLYVLGGGLIALGIGFALNAALLSANSSDNFFSHILADLTSMPKVMRQLAVVQFFSWFGLFLMWIYTTPTVTSRQFGAADVSSASYAAGADWVGMLFAVYNGVAMLYAFILPALAAQFGKRAVHVANLAIGAAGLASFFVITDPTLLLVSMVAVGIAWASILTVPYAILSDALPPAKMGVFMGIFNFFIVLPQIVVAGIMGPVVRAFFGGEPAWALILGGVAFLLAAASMSFVQSRST
ncbi:MAG: MFS transporter [Amphiplicatus sp.]